MDGQTPTFFRIYMKEHFLKIVQGRDNRPILVLCDSHRSHIGLDLIDWDNHIVRFVLPPHCSHVLQPIDIGCVGPLQLIHTTKNALHFLAFITEL